MKHKNTCLNFLERCFVVR